MGLLFTLIGILFIICLGLFFAGCLIIYRNLHHFSGIILCYSQRTTRCKPIHNPFFIIYWHGFI